MKCISFFDYTGECVDFCPYYDCKVTARDSKTVPRFRSKTLIPHTLPRRKSAKSLKLDIFFAVDTREIIYGEFDAMKNLRLRRSLYRQIRKNIRKT